MKKSSKRGSSLVGRRLVEYRYRKKKWIIVPHDYAMHISVAVAGAFYEMDQLLKTESIEVPKVIGAILRSFKKKTTAEICSLMNDWLPGSNGGSSGDGATLKIARTQLSLVLKSAFNTLHRRISDHSLVDTDDEDQKMVILGLVVLEDELQGKILALLEEWD